MDALEKVGMYVCAQGEGKAKANPEKEQSGSALLCCSRFLARVNPATHFWARIPRISPLVVQLRRTEIMTCDTMAPHLVQPLPDGAWRPPLSAGPAPGQCHRAARCCGDKDKNLAEAAS